MADEMGIVASEPNGVAPFVVRRARSGDDGAFAQLLEHYDPRVRALVALLLDDPEATDRVLRAAYLRAYRSLPLLGRDEVPGIWLYRTTYRTCLDELRRLDRRRRHPTARRQRRPGTSGGAATDAVAPADERPAFERVLAGIPADQRAALQMVDVDGFEPAAAAAVLDLAPEKVAALLETTRGALVASDRTDVAAALAERPVPPRDDAFWARLGELLIAEREAPAAPTFDPLERLADHAAGSADAGAPGDAAGAGAAEMLGLARHADRVRPKPNRRRQALIASGVIVVVAILTVATLIGLSGRPPDRGTTGAAMADRVAEALAGSPYLTGRLTVSGATPSGRTEHYVMTWSSDGSLRRQGTDVYSDASYDAQTGVARAVKETAVASQTAIDVAELVGVAAGPPDGGGVAALGVDDEVGDALRALRSVGSVRMHKDTVAGRAAWTIDAPLTPAAGSSVDRVRVSVDQLDLAPLAVTRYAGDRVVRAARFEGLQGQSVVPPAIFDLSLPAGRTPARADAGFQRVTLAAVRNLIGYDAPTPAWLPRGFELRLVTVRPGGSGAQSTAGGANPPDRDVVSFGYRHGPDQVTVTVRRDGGNAARWADPFGTASSAAGRSRQLLGLGRFHAATVERVAADAESSAHLWGRDGGLVFTVSGDRTVAELTRVAGSLG